jgi:hypothetical protein
MSRRAGQLILLAFLWGGCQHASTQAEYPRPSGEFRADGSVQYHDRSASFGVDRVVGPFANVSRRTDGSWAGEIAGLNVDVKVYGPDRIAGLNLEMNVQRQPTKLVIAGLFGHGNYRFEISREEVIIRLPGNRAATLKAVGPGRYGQSGILQLIGDANSLDAQMPQLGLTLLAALVR